MYHITKPHRNLKIFLKQNLEISLIFMQFEEGKLLISCSDQIYFIIPPSYDNMS